jgi:hypothetical protein
MRKIAGGCDGGNRAMARHSERAAGDFSGGTAGNSRPRAGISARGVKKASGSRGGAWR